MHMKFHTDMALRKPATVSEVDKSNDSWVHLQSLQTQLVQQQAASQKQNVTSALQIRLQAARQKTRPGTQRSPFERMQLCRDALERLDAQGWSRSYHQRLFHEDFLVSTWMQVCVCACCELYRMLLRWDMHDHTPA